jgi:hypothetical protein
LPASWIVTDSLRVNGSAARRMTLSHTVHVLKALACGRVEINIK